MPEFINSVIEYAKNNLVLVGIIAACVLLMIIALIAIGATSSKKKKQARKLAALQKHVKVINTAHKHKTFKINVYWVATNSFY